MWITWVDPRDGQSGELIYSGRLLESLARAGATVEVLCQSRPGAPARLVDGEPPIHWHRLAPNARPAWASLVSPLPNVAWRASRGVIACELRAQLARECWDWVIIDALHAGWAFADVAAVRARSGGARPRIVYVAHNHEETTRRRLAGGAGGSMLRRLAFARDADKAGMLERRMVDEADLVTAITDDDRDLFARRRGVRPIVVLPPGYDGPRRAMRRFGPDTPRRAVMVGSFHWVAKQMNLDRFVAVADPVFAAAGVELRVVGGGPEALFRRLSRKVRATRFTGPVERIEPHIEDARIAIVPEETGGGFKLKVLDYVFNRLPVACLDGSVAGTPLVAPDSMLSFPTFQALAAGVVAAIDDAAQLERLQARAFDACASRFDWQTRGEALCRAISDL